MDTIYFDESGKLSMGGRAIGHIIIDLKDFNLADCKSILPVSEDHRAFTLDNRKPKTKKELMEQVQYLRTLPQPGQRSKEWYEMRESRLTASDLAGAIGDSKYDKPFDILAKKCGFGKPFKGNFVTEWGVKYEPVAASIYTQRNQSELIEFGLLPHPEIPFLGASPDGISPEGIMLEIKCPYRREITGIVPQHYGIQMQLQLEVCDLERCDFEECKFSEYTSYQSFRDDHSDDPEKMVGKDGQEKGILLEFYDNKNGKNVYKYCPCKLSVRESIHWADAEEILQNGNGDVYLKARKYWKLEKYSCVTVSRDREWFEKALPKITAFWREVCYYRTQPQGVLFGDHKRQMKNDELEDEPEDPHKQVVESKSNVFIESDNEPITLGVVKNQDVNIFIESDNDEVENLKGKTESFDISAGLSNLKLNTGQDIHSAKEILMWGRNLNKNVNEHVRKQRSGWPKKSKGKKHVELDNQKSPFMVSDGE